jgi:hypothetical protein
VLRFAAERTKEGAMASDEMVEVEALLRQLAIERLEQAHEAGKLVAEILKRAPMRWVELGHGERVGSVLSIDLSEPTVDRLRELCELLTGIDGWALDHERLIGLLSLAALRGPLWRLSPLPDG